MTASTLPVSGARAPRDEALAAVFDWRVLGVFGVWLATMTVLGGAGVFLPEPGEPAAALLISVVAPPAAFALAYRVFPGVRAWVDRLDLAMVVGLQSWRVLGLTFLPLWAFGLLPAAFAVPAGVGDVAVGLSAPFVVYAIVRRTAKWRASVVGLTIAGVLDFILAVAAGGLAGEGGPLAPAGGPYADLTNVLPLSLIPTFIVPAFLILHLIALLKLRREH